MVNKTVRQVESAAFSTRYRGRRKSGIFQPHSECTNQPAFYLTISFQMASSPADNGLPLLSDSPHLRMTENKMGLMVEASDEYCNDFFDYVRSCLKLARVTDLGVAFGYTPRFLL